MNQTLKDIQERRSCRKYKPDMPPADVIEQICVAGSYAATGMNRQSPIIIAVTNKDMVARISKLNAAVMNSDRDPFYGAPVVLVVLADRAVRTHVYDGSLVMGNLMNAAHAEGVASCWIHRAKEVFDSPEGKEILKSLGIEGDYEGVGNLILGYAEGALPELKPRKDNYVYYID